MSPSNIAEVGIQRKRGVDTSREEKFAYQESGRKGVKFRLWKWNKFGWEWTVEESWGDCDDIDVWMGFRPLPHNKFCNFFAAT